MRFIDRLKFFGCLDWWAVYALSTKINISEALKQT